MVYFSEFFQLSDDVVEDYGAFNISLINDLPLFIDPFLLFGSEKVEYQKLHHEILDYLVFLKEKSSEGAMSLGQIKAWYYFSEVKQNWLGYSLFGNGGSGLGEKFGTALSSSMHLIFGDLQKEKITISSHLEKAGLFSIGVGKDNISDFTCNLIKGYLLEYTEAFTLKYLSESQRKKVKVKKVYFDYNLERWMPKEYTLPYHQNDYILLTPKDILTKDENWINNQDLLGDFNNICGSIPNEQLRIEIQNYLNKAIPKSHNKKPPAQKDINKAMYATINQFPVIIEYYIKKKEENKEGAKRTSKFKVKEVESVFIKNVQILVEQLRNLTDFYSTSEGDAHTEALKRVHFMKHVIEDNEGYKIFYYNGNPIKREADLQVIYRLTWYASIHDVNREVNNGRGPVDYAISSGIKDKVLVEFKLASNTQLKRNLQNQVAVYEKANQTSNSLKVILYFDNSEYMKVNKILKELSLDSDPNIILIDAGCDNKKSASKV
jgi:hypothetical protein